MNSPLPRWATCASASLLLAAISPALAQQPGAAPLDSQSSTNFHDPLGDVIITATGIPKPPTQVPYTVDKLSNARLRQEEMAASVPEALLRVPGVQVQQTAHGQGSPFIRGFTGFRTLMLVDGIRLNNSTFREGPNQYWSTVDVLAVERLEVIKGPSSVLYGTDAIGGAVNAFMRGPRYGFGDGPLWGGSTYYRFGSAERAHLGRGEFSGADAENWGFSLGASAKSFGDVQGGQEVGRQPHTGFDQWDFDSKAEYFFTPKTKLTLAYQHTEQDEVERTHRTIYGLTWRGLTRGTDLQHSFDQERDLVYARLSAETERGDQFQGTLSWHDQYEYQFVERANRTTQKNETDVGTLGIHLRGDSPSPVGLWSYGAEYYRDAVDSSQRNFDAAGALTSVGIQGPVADDSAYDLAGVYVQNDTPLGEQFSLILGSRYSYARADAGRVRDPITAGPASYEQDWQTVVGNARLLWNPDEAKEYAVFTGAAQGYRTPNLSDISRFDIARSGELETAVFDLEPEKFLTLEIGSRVAKKRWSAQASYYHTFIEDLIVRAPTGAIIGGLAEVTKRNAGEGFVQGVEVSGEFSIVEGLTLYGSIAWQEGEADGFPTSAATAVRGPMSRMHPLTAIPGLRWDYLNPRAPIFAEVFGVIAAEQDRLSFDDARDTQRIPPGGTPAYATLNFRAGYDWRGRLKLVAALENALNEDYRIHGSGYNQPGRNFKISCEYRF
ncbi:MAG TPA: TonB-dependent receptor [Methylomirabilota bacterium]|nr:TonB-dependent receptor [Methylomirabilota bacterium]